jgi:allene oxide cyclase
MRKRLALLAAAAFAGSVVVAAFVMSTAATAATTLTVIEHATSDHVTDIGKTGDSKGDLLTFSNAVYDQTDTNVVGSDQGSCIRISPKAGSWECQWTTILTNGNSSSSITVESPFYDTAPSVGAVTGGTGAFAGASGTMDLSCTGGDCTSGEYTFVFNLA